MSRPPFDVSLVILDVDGTLVDFVGALRAGLDAVARDVSGRAGGVEVGSDRLWELRNEVARDPRWQGRTLTAIRRESFRRILEAFSLDDGAVDEVQELYYRVRNDSMTVFPEVEEALTELRDLGLRLVAASNGNLPLATVGLDGYFEATHYAEDVGISKPDPAFFTTAVERVAGSVETTLAVGDRLDNDYEPARAAGLHAALLDRRGRVDDEAIVRVRALTELVELVELLESG